MGPWKLPIIRVKLKPRSISNRIRGHRRNCTKSKATSQIHSQSSSEMLFSCSSFCFSKRKVRGLYGYWTDSLYSIDIDQFESFLKQQKKEAKHAAKHPQAATTAASASADSADPDEDLPDLDPSHEQMNLPPNSITLWRIIPKLDYAAQVSTEDIVL